MVTARSAVVLGIAFLAGSCSASDEELPTRPLEVQVVAEFSGLGSCMESPVVKDTTIILKDADGTTVGTSSFDKTKGAGACDWTATFDAVPESDFYELSTSEGEILATVPSDSIDGDKVVLEVDYSGRTTPANRP